MENDIEITDIDENITLIKTNYDDVKLYLISLNNFKVLFDSATDAKIREILMMIDKPKYAIITHAHPDHAGGTGYLYSNGVITSSNITNKCLLYDENIMSKSFIPEYIQKEFNYKSFIKDYIEKIKVECKNPKIGSIEYPRIDGLKIINGKGHTSGTLLIYYNGLLFTSDGIQGTGINGRNRTDAIPQIWSINNYLMTLNNIKKLNINTIVPGHNFMPFNKPLIEGNNVQEFIYKSEEYVYKLLNTSFDILIDKMTLMEFTSKLLGKTGHKNEVYPQAFITSMAILNFIKNDIFIEKEGDEFMYKLK